MRWNFVIVAVLTLCGCTLQALEEPLIEPETGSGGGTVKGQGADVQNVQMLLSQQSASDALKVGAQDAPHTLTVFTEYHCSYCTEFHRNMETLLNEFIQSGDLNVRFFFLPLKKYPNSESAIRGLFCAEQAGQGLRMHELLTERQNKHRSSAIAYAEELDIDATSFATCLDSAETTQLVESHRKLASDLNVSLLPTFFLDGERMTGLPVDAELKGWIREKVRSGK